MGIIKCSGFSFFCSLCAYFLNKLRGCIVSNPKPEVMKDLIVRPLYYGLFPTLHSFALYMFKQHELDIP